MKILVACDGRSSADKLYSDLNRAGLPESAEVFVLSVADVFLVPGYKEKKSKRPADKTYLMYIDQEMQKARAIASSMSRKLKSKFPRWRFHAEVSGGSPVGEILNKARERKVDLIVVGSHGRIGVGEFFFGSVALKVLSESACSVRIVRSRTGETDSPSRIVIGVDGSVESDALITRLAARHWKKGSAVHLVTAVNLVVYTAFLLEETVMSPMVATVSPECPSIKKEWRTKDKNTTAWIKKMHEEYKSKLEKAGLIVSTLIKDGDPKVVLMEEARRWGADCIFVGAIGHDRMDRFLIGSVSSSIAARAHCSVEVVRNKKNRNNSV